MGREEMTVARQLFDRGLSAFEQTDDDGHELMIHCIL